MALWPLACALLGALTFVQQDLPGLTVGAVNELTGATEGQFRQADIDGDGLTDLVLPTKIALQRDGLFPEDSRHNLPELNGHPLCDVWKQDLYFLFERQLTVFTWRDGKLVSKSSHDCTWPAAFQDSEFEEIEARHLPDRVRFQRFLYDLDGDGTPEIVIPQDTGLVIYALTADGCEKKAQWPVFPAPQIAPTTQQALWPPDERRLSFPMRQMSCLYYVEDRNVTVIQQEPADEDGMSRFELTRYAMVSKPGLDLSKDKPAKLETPPLPSWLQPCRLNSGGEPAFAGGRLLFSQASIIPMPVFETYVSTDSGQDKQVFRSQYIRPQCLFVDMNDDGRKDLISEHTSMFSGGPRETIERALTSTQIEHNVTIHYQDSHGHFPTTPSSGLEVTIHLAKVPYRNGPMLALYRRGALVNCTGDLDGDGWRDIVVHDRMNRLAVYLNHAGRFDAEPSTTLSVDNATEFALVDVNGDGKSDIVIMPPAGTDEAAHLFLSRGPH